MSSFIAIFMVLALLLAFPIFLFWMLVRAVREPGTRWWGIIILLSLLTCYCTTMVGFIGLVVGGNATGSAEMEQRYCEQFREALARTQGVPRDGEPDGGQWVDADGVAGGSREVRRRDEFDGEQRRDAECARNESSADCVYQREG